MCSLHARWGMGGGRRWWRNGRRIKRNYILNGESDSPQTHLIKYGGDNRQLINFIFSVSQTTR